MFVRKALILLVGAVVGATIFVSSAEANSVTLNAGMCTGGGYTYRYGGWDSGTYELYNNSSCWRYVYLSYIDHGSLTYVANSGYSNVSVWVQDNGDRVCRYGSHTLFDGSNSQTKETTCM